MIWFEIYFLVPFLFPFVSSFFWIDGMIAKTKECKEMASDLACLQFFRDVKLLLRISSWSLF